VEPFEDSEQLGEAWHSIKPGEGFSNEPDEGENRALLRDHEAFARRVAATTDDACFTGP